MWTKTPPTEPGAYHVVRRDAFRPEIAFLFPDNLFPSSRHWSVLACERFYVDADFDWFWPEPIEFPPLPDLPRRVVTEEERAAIRESIRRDLADYTDVDDC
jgi:hypothetical protein